VRQQLVVADLNDDDQVDVVIGDEWGTYVFAGPISTNKDKNFATELPLSSTFAVGDHNGQGQNDLAYITPSGDAVTLILGESGQSYTHNGIALGAVAFVPDADGDGRDELVVGETFAAFDTPVYVHNDFITASSLTDTHTTFRKGESAFLAGGLGFADDDFRLVIGGTSGGAYVLKPLLQADSRDLPLDGNNELLLDGYVSGNDVGRPTIIDSVSGDGDSDLVLSNPLFNGNSGMFSLGFEVQQDLDTPDATFTNDLPVLDPGTLCGWAVASGDFNGDGHQDLVTSRSDANLAGSVRIWWGPVEAGSHHCTGETSFDGNTGDRFGNYLATGDVTGDGVDDLLIAAPGLAIVYIMAGENGL
jgi:hypothetical protein